MKTLVKNLMILIFGFAVIPVFAPVFARDFYGKGYAIVEESTTTDDLQVIVYSRITGENLFSALNELLEGTGWQLANTLAADPFIHRLYQQKLPQQKRNIGPIQLDHALQWFAGDAWDLVVDPVNKLISFDLKPQYRPVPIVTNVTEESSK